MVNHPLTEQNPLQSIVSDDEFNDVQVTFILEKSVNRSLKHASELAIGNMQ